MIKLLLGPVMPWLAGAAFLALLGAGGYVMTLQGKVATQRAEIARLSAELITCGARVKNIIEDRKSDAQIPDNLDGFTVPDSWLRP